MDKEYFINSNQLDHQTWQSLSSSIEIQPSQTPDCFLSPQPSSENLLIRELIGRLGNICNSSEITTNAPPSLPPYIGGGGCCSTNNSSYSTPLSSPPKIGMQIMDHLVKDNYPCLGNSIALGSTLPAMPGDPGFAERAARFSSFGSRSFNGRTTQFGANNTAELGYISNNNNNNNNNNSSKLQRVSSSPLLKVVGSQAQNLNDKNQNLSSELNQGELINSRENSSVSGPNPGGDNAPNRKRKAAPKGKTKETQCKIAGENGEDSSAKRSKSEEVNGIEEAKTEENRGDEGKKHNNSSQKPPEPPKDYIHVRARRGQATDSHSLAERVRREKISERMKLLQDLVPGCNKVTGKALMLDEIINYVQSLQRQVEFLSMKLASVNPRLDFNVDNLFSKDHVIQPNCSIQHPMYPLQSLTPTLYGQPHQNGLQNTSSSLTNEGSMVPFSMDPLNPTPNQNHALQLPPIDGFPNVIPQLSSLCEGDLQSIVQMSYGHNENEFQSQHLHGPNQTPLMKIEF